MSFLEILAERRQKSISVEFNFTTVFAFKHHVSGVMLQLTDILLKIVQIARGIPMHLLLQMFEGTLRLTGVCVNESNSAQLCDYKTNT